MNAVAESVAIVIFFFSTVKLIQIERPYTAAPHVNQLDLKKITLYVVRLMDHGCSFSTWRKFFVCDFFGQRVRFCSTFIVSTSSIICFRLFSKPRPCRQRYQIFQEP